MLPSTVAIILLVSSFARNDTGVFVSKQVATVPCMGASWTMVSLAVFVWKGVHK